ARARVGLVAVADRSIAVVGDLPVRAVAPRVLVPSAVAVTRNVEPRLERRQAHRLYDLGRVRDHERLAVAALAYRVPVERHDTPVTRIGGFVPSHLPEVLVQVMRI